MGALNAQGYEKSYFQPTSWCILETVQDVAIVAIERE